MMTAPSCRTLLLALCPALLLAVPPRQSASAVPAGDSNPGTPGTSPLPAMPKAPMLRPAAADPVPMLSLADAGLGGAAMPAPPADRGLAQRARSAVDETQARAGSGAPGFRWSFRYENVHCHDVLIKIDREEPGAADTVFFAPDQDCEAIGAVAGHSEGPIRVPAGETVFLAVDGGDRGVWIHASGPDGSRLLDDHRLGGGSQGILGILEEGKYRQRRGRCGPAPAVPGSSAPCGAP